MTLKTKLSLGLGFLFIIIFILVGFCSYYVGKLGQESDNILKDNYHSIVYANNMLSGFDEMKTSVIGITHSAVIRGTVYLIIPQTLQQSIFNFYPVLKNLYFNN
jgi:hypothetical protein